MCIFIKCNKCESVFEYFVVAENISRYLMVDYLINISVKHVSMNLFSIPLNLITFSVIVEKKHPKHCPHARVHACMCMHIIGRRNCHQSGINLFFCLELAEVKLTSVGIPAPFPSEVGATKFCLPSAGLRSRTVRVALSASLCRIYGALVLCRTSGSSH